MLGGIIYATVRALARTVAGIGDPGIGHVATWGRGHRPPTPEKRESGEGDECTFAASLNIALRTTRFTFD